MRDQNNRSLSLSVSYIHKENNKITVSFLPSKELQPFFNSSNIFYAEYSENIENVPDSCAIIPFLVNILPIVWLADVYLYIDTIDKSFYESIDSFKQGYIDMYPMLSFKGHIKASQIVDNTNPTFVNTGMMFSGGVDAFSTLLMHCEETPTPISVIGADIKLDDTEGIKNMTEHANMALQNLSMNSPYFITSNFRSFLNEKQFDALGKKSNDACWHGFQHGIGLIGLSAPVAYTRKLSKLYIASSHTPNEIFTCASHPSIDNNIRFTSTVIVHDQYENTRQKKISIICDYHRKTNKPVLLRVCWESRGGRNCCHCEKCLRTIYALYAEGENPNDYGFNYTIPELIEASNKLRKKIPFIKEAKRVFWIDIQKRFKETQQCTNHQYLNWVLNEDFNKKASCSMQMLFQLKKSYWYFKSVIRHLQSSMH